MTRYLRWPLLATLLLILAAALTAAAGWSKARLRGATGLVETLFQGTDFSGPPLLQRPTGAIDLSALDEHPQLSRRNFSLRFSGTWLVPPPGPVDLYAGGDDQVRVFIDNALIIERSQALGFSTRAAGAPIGAGPHQILIEYVQRGGGATLNVLWAPAGQPARPIPPESLFVGPPGAGLIARARFAARAAELARAAWIALGFVLTAAALPALGRRGRRWIAAGVPQDLARRTFEVAEGWRARYGRLAFGLASISAIIWAVATRAAALDPPTLWSDDVAVACLAKIESLWTAITTPAPLGPGFVALLWIARRVIPDPEVSLQLFPFVFGLIGPVLLGLFVSRLTSSYLLGITAVALGLGAEHLAQYSVFVKPYSLDYAVAALWLLLGARLLVDRVEGRTTAAAAGLAAVLFSTPSVLLSVALVHTALLSPGGSAAAGQRFTRRRWTTVAGFDLLLLLIFAIVIRGRTNPALRAWWTGGFVPTTSLAAFTDFLRTTGWAAIREALPPPLAAFAPLSVVGLGALLINQRTRWFGGFVALAYAGAIAASMLQLYPIGIGVRARASIYSYAMTAGLVVAGFDALTRWLPVRALIRTAAAVGVAVCVARLVPPAYPQLDQARLARALESSATRDDAIVLNTPGASVAGYYTSWPVSTYPDQSSYGFAVRLERPRTLTLPRASEDGGEPGLDVLERFLAREQPARVFLFSTRRGTEAAERTIRGRGFAEAHRTTGSVSAQLIEYHRGDSH